MGVDSGGEGRVEKDVLLSRASAPLGGSQEKLVLRLNWELTTAGEAGDPPFILGLDGAGRKKLVFRLSGVLTGGVVEKGTTVMGKGVTVVLTLTGREDEKRGDLL